MPKPFSSLYTLVFVGAIAVVCAFLLALAASGLRPMQRRNVTLDKARNILSALAVDHEQMGREEVFAFFQDNVDSYFVNVKGQRLEVEDIEPKDLDVQSEERSRPLEAQRLPVFELRQDGQVQGYAIPIAGPGLWGLIYGYLALEADADQIRGITFYDHKETPGLGAEIEARWFREQFLEDKRIWDDGELVGVSVVRGAKDKYPDPDDLAHHVDAISGATKTSEAVSDILQHDLKKYEAFLRRQRRTPNR